MTSYWAAKKGLGLDNLEFEVRVKPMKISTEWKKDQLQKNIDAPWKVAGRVKWVGGRFVPELQNVEKL